MDRERAALVEHVRAVQKNVRSCDGCGLCCTAEYNSVRIGPDEARRIGNAVASRPPKVRAALIRRIDDAIARFHLAARPDRQRYTCPFLETDLTCALTFAEKPVACLSFNPVTRDRCEMDTARFERAHAAIGRSGGADVSTRVPIPVAVATVLRRADAAAPSSSSGPSRSHPLPRVLSKWHVASRQGAETLVRAGRVTVNGAVVKDVARMVNPTRDRIAVDGAPIAPPGANDLVFVVLNKPRGYVTTTRDPEGRPTVMDLVAAHSARGLAPVGRLDKDSAGLLLLTNDHATAARLLDPANHVAKTYRVKVKGRLTESTLERLRTETVTVDGLVLHPVVASIESTGPRSTWLSVTLEEGRNRQIRRQCEALGHEVEVLIRTSFGPLTLDGLAPGESRALEAPEVARLRNAAE